MLSRDISIRFLFSCLTWASLTSCDSFQKEIVIPQSPYEQQLVVECYLEQGKPYRMALTESVNYLAAPQLPIVSNATVKISYAGQIDELTSKTLIDSTTRKAYNYILEKTVDGNPNLDYTLDITDPKGRKVTGSTRFLPHVPIKEINWGFNEKGKAYLTATFDDPPNETDFYRWIVSVDSLTGNVKTQFIFNDLIHTNHEITLGTRYDFEEGDTVVVSLFHIDKPYYDFLQSATTAANANGNPFGQPSQVASTVKGGIGLFTALVYDRQTVIIKKK